MIQVLVKYVTKRQNSILMAVSAFATAGIMAVSITPPAEAATLSLQNAKPDHITIYTHGDTLFAQLKPDGTITGPTPPLLDCAMAKMNMTYNFSIAPLSRANSIVATAENAIWFPSAHRGDEERMKQLVGPVFDASIFWYQLKTNTQDPNSEDFRTSGVVTAYQGSNFEKTLIEQGYNLVQGSADHNRLIYMVMSGEVDALQAIDFRAVLKPETRKLVKDRMRITLHRKIPLSFHVSAHTIENAPTFLQQFRNAINAC